jgi:hypothetical protein
MSSTLDTTHESSVMFNLRQLMRLEEECVADEERAIREERAAHEQASLMKQQRAAAEMAERARLEEAERERVRVERDAALLRVQLEAAAAERAHEAQLERAHADKLADVHADYHARSARSLHCTVPMVMMCMALAAAGAWWTGAQRAVPRRERNACGHGTACSPDAQVG